MKKTGFAVPALLAAGLHGGRLAEEAPRSAEPAQQAGGTGEGRIVH